MLLTLVSLSVSGLCGSHTWQPRASRRPRSVPPASRPRPARPRPRAGPPSALGSSSSLMREAEAKTRSAASEPQLGAAAPPAAPHPTPLPGQQLCPLSRPRVAQPGLLGGSSSGIRHGLSSQPGVLSLLPSFTFQGLGVGGTAEPVPLSPTPKKKVTSGSSFLLF